MVNQNENVIIKVNSEDVLLPADYLHYTYEIDGKTTIGFFDLLRNYPWAIKHLGKGGLIINDDVTITVQRPNYDIWAYQPKTFDKERLIQVYVDALDAGDLDTVGDILKQAETDDELSDLIWATTIEWSE